MAALKLSPSNYFTLPVSAGLRLLVDVFAVVAVIEQTAHDDCDEIEEAKEEERKVHTKRQCNAAASNQ